jgi:L-ascorbate metabolism protein UlaG (beta-lactamase superfamily)
MNPAWLKDDALLADLGSAATSPDSLHAWWLGQSGFLLQWAGHRCLLDPYLSDSLTTKYAGTDRPHVRVTERVIAPDRLEGIEVVTSSHNHTDHLDADTLLPLRQANPTLQMVIPEANRDFVCERLGVARDWPLGLNDAESVTVGAFTFRAVPAAHDQLETDAAGRHKYLSYVIQCGPWTVYHSGDTRWYDGLEQRLRGFRIDLGLLPINGWAPERRVAGNLDISEAVSLGLNTGMALVVPHHFDMFAFNTANPTEFQAEAARRGLRARVLHQGERLTLVHTP